MRAPVPSMLLAAAVLLLATPARAVPIIYQLQQGVEAGFDFSGLHDADDDTPMSGDPLGELHGTITFEYQSGPNNYIFSSSTVWLDSKEYTFELTGGMISGSGGGFLGFALQGAGPYAQEGEIVFSASGPVCCGATGPNRIDPRELRLWGAVDGGPSDGVAGAPKRFAMGLGAGSAMPEPSAAVVFGAGLLLVQGAVRGRPGG